MEMDYLGIGLVSLALRLLWAVVAMTEKMDVFFGEGGAVIWKVS